MFACMSTAPILFKQIVVCEFLCHSTYEEVRGQLSGLSPQRPAGLLEMFPSLPSIANRLAGVTNACATLSGVHSVLRIRTSCSSVPTRFLTMEPPPRPFVWISGTFWGHFFHQRTPFGVVWEELLEVNLLKPRFKMPLLC